MNIRPFAPTTADYNSVVAIHNASEPQFPDTPEQWRHWDENRDPKYRFQRWLCALEDDPNTIVAYSSLMEPHWSYQPGKFFVNVTVHPDYQNRGIGSQLYDHLMKELRPLKPARLVTETRENRTNALRFLQKRGFQPKMRYPISELDVTQFDPAPFAGRLERTREAGIQIRSLIVLRQTDPEWLQKAYDLEWQILQDVPSPDQITPIGVEQYEKEILTNPGFSLEAYFVALDGDRWVGMSNLWRNLANDKRMGTGLTGVLRSHRRRGIATALKVTAIEYARQQGTEVIDTSNEEHNPMLELNVQLGFRPTPAFIDYAKELNGSNATTQEWREENGHHRT